MTTAQQLPTAEQLTGPLWDEFDVTESSSRADELRSLLVGADELARREPPPPLVDDFLFVDSLAWLQGKPGVGKSFLALDVAGCVAAGIPWHGREVAQGPVLYLLAEGDGAFGPRVSAWRRANGRDLAGVTFLPTSLCLLDEPTVRGLAEIAGELRPSLMIIDTQARVTVGADENSSKDMGRLVAALDQLRVASAGACILTLHHERRNGANLRGSTALEGAANTIIRLKPNGASVETSCEKQKDANPFKPFKLAIRPIGSSAVIRYHRSGAATASELRIVETFRDNSGTGGLTSGQLEELSGLKHSTFHRALTALRDQGVVVNIDRESKPLWVLARANDS